MMQFGILARSVLFISAHESQTLQLHMMIWLGSASSFFFFCVLPSMVNLKIYSRGHQLYLLENYFWAGQKKNHICLPLLFDTDFDIQSWVGLDRLAGQFCSVGHLLIHSRKMSIVRFIFTRLFQAKQTFMSELDQTLYNTSEYSTQRSIFRCHILKGQILQ